MKNCGVLVLCAALAVLLSGCGGSASYMGEWKIVKQLENAPMGDLADGDLGRIVGASLVFNSNQASCFGDSVDTLGVIVPTPEYVVSEYPRQSLESAMGVGVQDLGGGNGDTVTQVAVVRDSERNTGIVMYVINKDTLVVNGAGTFFLLERTGK